MRKLLVLLASAACFSAIPASAAPSPEHPNILQRPAMSTRLIVFGYAGDLWSVPREGGKATRLTAGVGIETQPVFSPDGQTLAFTGEYDGNTDVFTIPVSGGIPKRITYHPAADYAVGWTPDGNRILFRSNRSANSRYTELFTVPANGGEATRLPLPMAYAGTYSPDGSRIAYAPLPPAFGFDYTNYTAWGNYHGGRAGVIRITTLPGLDSVDIPHEDSSDFSPVYIGDQIFFLSGRKGHIGVFQYDPQSQAVTEIFHNTATDIHSLATDGHDLLFDQLGELYTLEPKPGAQPRAVPVEIAADLPEVRPRLKNVAGEIENYSLSPSALRVAVEAHGEILTVPAKHGPVRNLTNSPGAMERDPAWSPDGQSVAYFSDAPNPGAPGPDGKPGLYHLDIAPQTGGAPVRRFALAPEPAFYFDPLWSPDSKHLVFRDNRMQFYVLDAVSGKVRTFGEPQVFGGFSSAESNMAWSPDSKWVVYPRSLPNHLHALYLYSLETGASTQLTDEMADAKMPAFDRNGKYLYFLASNNQGATEAGLDMTSDLYQPTQSIYALTLSARTASPVAPELADEKTPAEVKEKAKDNADSTPAGAAGEAKADEEKHPDTPHPPTPAKPTVVDLPGMPVDAIARRIVALPLPPAFYSELKTGKAGTIYFLEASATGRFNDEHGLTLSRWLIEGRKTEKLAEHVEDFQLSAEGDKMLLHLASEGGEDAAPRGRTAPRMVIVPATAPVKAGEGAVSFAQVEVRVDPKAEWAQMYHEVWRVERAYFYDAHFHGANTEAEERQFAPYVQSIASRADLNYIFQEMLSAFSVGHLRGSGGAIPEAPRVPGGLLGADYAIRNNRYCFTKIYTGGSWSPGVKAPLAQPGLDVAAGDCILAIDNEPLTAAVDIQQPLEGTAGHVVTLHIAGPNGERPRDLSVVPVPSEAALRNTEWIDANQRKVAQFSGGKLAYVYLPDTGAGGFTNFNRYFFAQTNRQGVIVDERFNAGGQIADYIVEVLNRKLESYWAPRYGATEHTPNDAIYGPKVMIANEFSGSGGDAMPWLFKYNKVGTLVGKRTWGGLVGIGNIPVLMDGGAVTSPSVAFFSPEGKWDVENHGVDPDIVIDQDPKAVAEGHDPQLEKAVSVAMEELAKHPVPEPHKPAYPHYSY